MTESQAGRKQSVRQFIQVTVYFASAGADAAPEACSLACMGDRWHSMPQTASRGLDGAEKRTFGDTIGVFGIWELLQVSTFRLRETSASVSVPFPMLRFISSQLKHDLRRRTNDSPGCRRGALSQHGQAALKVLTLTQLQPTSPSPVRGCAIS